MINSNTNQVVELRAVITRADGTTEDLGVIATSDDKINPNSKLGKIYYKLKKVLRKDDK